MICPICNGKMKKGFVRASREMSLVKRKHKLDVLRSGNA